MADDPRSSGEIERELEQERAELRGTLDQLLQRLTFEDAWERTGRYLRENRSEYGQTLGRMIKEKPIALALTAVGISWLIFGPASSASRDREASDARPRRLSDADREPNWGPPPISRAETPARASERPPASRPTSGAGAEAIPRDVSGVAAKPATSSQSTLGSSELAKATGSTSSSDVSTSSSSPASPDATSRPGAGSTSTAGAASEMAKDRPLGSPSATSTASGEKSQAASSTPVKPAAEPKPQSSSETSDQDKEKFPKPLP